MKLHLSRSFFTLFLFVACVALVLLAQGGPVQACGHEAGSGQEIQVVEGPLLIRDAPAGEIVGALAIGATLAITEQAEAGNYLWGRHALGWSALHSLDCSDVYTQALGAVEAAPADDTDMMDDTSMMDDTGVMNRCMTEWDCNTGTPDEIAYLWRVGWYAGAQDAGIIPPHAKPEELAAGETSSLVPEMTPEPS